MTESPKPESPKPESPKPEMATAADHPRVDERRVEDSLPDKTQSSDEAPEEAVAQASSDGGSLGPAVSFEQFKAIWPGLFGGLRDLLGVRRWALFRDSEPGGVEGNRLIITVRHEFHLEALRSDPAVSAIVATRAGDLLGASVAVEFRSEEGSEVSAVEVEDHPTEKEQLLDAPNDPTDPFQLLQSELGGTVVDEFDIEPE